MTQQQLAAATGIPLRTYQDIERGSRHKPPFAQLINCAIVLDCTIDELLEDRHRTWTEFTAGIKAPTNATQLRHRS